jgi:hypothetical protein
VRAAFARGGLETDADHGPIVAWGPNAADPHYEPSAGAAGAPRAGRAPPARPLGARARRPVRRPDVDGRARPVDDRAHAGVGGGARRARRGAGAARRSGSAPGWPCAAPRPTTRRGR